MWCQKCPNREPCWHCRMLSIVITTCITLHTRTIENLCKTIRRYTSMTAKAFNEINLTPSNRRYGRSNDVPRYMHSATALVTQSSFLFERSVERGRRWPKNHFSSHASSANAFWPELCWLRQGSSFLHFSYYRLELEICCLSTERRRWPLFMRHR